MNRQAVMVKGLHKWYGTFHAVRGVDFTAQQGEIVAILGPNGAGKTTILEILEGYRRQSRGSVSVLGFDPGEGGSEFRARIGIVLQTSGMYEELTVLEALSLFAGYYPRPRKPKEAVELVGLEQKAGIRVKALSGGERRRLDFALGIIGNPELIFLDEPTTGFDPEARRKFWRVIKDLASLGKTILLTTHYMEEAQVLADCVLVLAEGHIVAEGDVTSLIARLAPSAVVSFRVPEAAVLASLPPEIRDLLEVRNNEVRIKTREPEVMVDALTAWSRRRDEMLEALQVIRPSLEDVYLELVGGRSNSDEVKSP
jgi:ABC-2 type transport system ATP-binding protein